jgi:hypothetical protein
MDDKSPPLPLRDGISQPMRRTNALDPDHAQVDERSVQDLLAFACEYGKELVYYNQEDEKDGPFDAFIDPRAIDDLAKLAEDPEAVVDERVRKDLRPHLALFLAFVKLLGHAKGQLNTLTGRHLDFYLREILGMKPRLPAVDRAYVLAKLARNAEQALLPAGTLLDGGKDSQGKDRAYRTDRDVVVNRTEIAQIASVFVEREVTTLETARQAHTSDADAALLAMLALALGDPRPGDPLPAYKSADPAKSSEPVSMELLKRLGKLSEFSRPHLGLELFEVFELARLVDSRASEDAEWAEINEALGIAAHRRDPSAVFAPTNPKDFNANLAAAMGGAPNFAALPDVVTIDDVYYQRSNADVDAFIKAVLHFESTDKFAGMMQRKIRIADEWREINRIIEFGGRVKRGDPTYRLSPADPTNFTQNLDKAVGPVDWSGLPVSNVVAYRAEILALESAFLMSAEDFSFLMKVHAMAVHAMADPDAKGPTAKDWRHVYDILQGAYARKVETTRRERLKESSKQAASPIEGIRLALIEATGVEHAAEALPLLVERVCDSVSKSSDIDFLHDIVEAAPTRLVLRDVEWDRVVAIVDQARQVKKGFERLIPRKIEWLNIHAYEDATSVEESLGIEADNTTPRWKTFGAARTITDSSRSPMLGVAITSPVLSLREGQRTVVLTLGFLSKGFDAARISSLLALSPFAVAISTAEGFKEIKGVTPVLLSDYRAVPGVAPGLPEALPALQITFTLGAESEPITAPPSEPAPAVRLLLCPIVDAKGRHILPYDALAGLVLAAVNVSVSVTGLSALALENDRSVLDAKKPFEPFGASPGVGSRFVVGHPEVCEKRLDTLAFHVEWMKAPADLAAHYAAYGITPDFKARIALVDRRREINLTAEAPLFAASDARNPHVIAISDVRVALKNSNAAYSYGRDPASGAQVDRVSTWPRSLVFELSPLDFQHSAYPRIAAQKASDFTAKVAITTGTTPVDASVYQVPAPYTPLIKSFTVDYTASAEAQIGAGAGAGDIQIRHVHPFGSCDVNPEPGQSLCLLPRYDEFEGELYLGLRGVKAPQTLSLLFQMAEGSANPDLEPAPLSFSYLNANRWKSLQDGHLLSDGTRGLQGTGIVELSLPEAAPSTCMPAGLTWLRVAVREGTTSVCDVVAIHPQAVPVTFVDRGNAPDHYAAPLPPASLKKPFKPVRGIAGVEQPYPSSGGAMAESDADFQIRASERLRHKQRALGAWDYERLVLERFPEIYRVKCVPAGGFEETVEPGRVTLVVIPDIRDRIPFDPFEPKAPAATLAAIGGYLADKLPLGARLAVQNAHFTAVKVRMTVRFLPGSDEGFYKKKLSDEICRFLSPWAYDESADIPMGRRVYAGSIIDFADRRPYVDYVERITLLYREGSEFILVPRQDTGEYYVDAGRPDGVLVAAREHEIETSQQERAAKPGSSGAAGEAESAARSGIDFMRVGQDFIVLEPVVSAGSTFYWGLGIENMIVEEDFAVA